MTDGTPISVRSIFRTKRYRGPGTSVIWLLMLASIASACRNESSKQPTTAGRSVADSTEETSTRAPAPTPDWTRYYEMPLRVFPLADFLKPAVGSATERVVAMAPLVVLEVDERRPERRFGLPAGMPTSTAADGESSQPVVYYVEDSTTLGGLNRDRLTYLWRYEWPNEHGDVLPETQGFRMTLDENGYAVLSELLSSTNGPGIIFVAKSVEDAAEREFGPAIPPRRFAVERPIEEAPETVVARIVSDGPQPMGPFAYVDANRHEITTLICRCMASQFDAVRNNAYYQLRPLPVEGPEASEGVREMHAVLASADSHPLDERIRIPSLLERVP